MIDKGIKYLSSLSPRELLILAIIIVVSVLIIRSILNNETLKSRIKYNVLGAKPNDGSDLKGISDSRKLDVQQKAVALYNGINDPWGTAENALASFNSLNDSEFIYAYKFYISEYGTNPYCDVDWEVLPETQEDELFMNRAKNLNLPIKSVGFFDTCED